jgi:hypothetical protein
VLLLDAGVLLLDAGVLLLEDAPESVLLLAPSFLVEP